MANITFKKRARQRRKMHVRKSVRGTAERPRLVVQRTLRHISASLVDDDRGMTITGISDRRIDPKEFPVPEEGLDFGIGDVKLPLTPRVALAYQIGLAIAATAKERGIEKIVFDRNGLRYHGRVRAVAEGARKGGLEF